MAVSIFDPPSTTLGLRTPVGYPGMRAAPTVCVGSGHGGRSPVALAMSIHRWAPLLCFGQLPVFTCVYRCNLEEE